MTAGMTIAALCDTENDAGVDVEDGVDAAGDRNRRIRLSAEILTDPGRTDPQLLCQFPLGQALSNMCSRMTDARSGG